MPESDQIRGTLGGGSERRSHPRWQVRSLSYVDLGAGNGGIILNLSEGGLAVQAVTSLIETDLPHLRFQLSESRKWLETSGRITWKSESRKVVGVEFVNLTDGARSQLKEWLASGNVPVESQEPEVAAPSREARAFSPPVAADSLLFIPEPVSERPSMSPAVPKIAEAEPSHEPSGATFTNTQTTDPIPVFSESILTGRATFTQAKEAPSHVEDSSRSLPTLIALFVFLAIVSLVVGWSAGRGGLRRLISQMKVENPPTDSNHTPAEIPSASPAAKVTKIEIQDLGNRSRSIPFDGPLALDNVTAQHGTGQHQSPDKNNFQVWVLSPPVRSQGAIASAEKLNPPVLTNVPSSSTSVLPPSGGFESRSSIPSLPAPAPPVQPSPQHVGVLQQGRLIHRVEPLYPAVALASHIEGTVKLHAVIGENGYIRTLESLSGPDSLVDPAMNAVRQWRYTPTLLDGKPIETDQDIFIVFRLPQNR